MQDKHNQGKPLTSVNQIVDKIKHMIVDNQMNIGDRFPNESELCVMFGKSRSSIREAIKVLEYYGVLNVRQGDGTYLQAAPDYGMFDALFFQIMAKGLDFSELIEMREIIETGILKLVIARQNEDIVQQLFASHQNLETLTCNNSPIEKLVEADLDFHLILAKASQNETLEKIYINMLELFIPFIYNSYIPQISELGYSVLSQHYLIVKSVMERENSLAEYAIKSAMRDWENLNTKSPKLFKHTNENRNK